MQHLAIMKQMCDANDSNIKAFMCAACSQVDGECRFEPRSHSLEWVIQHVDDTNRSGSLECVVPDAKGVDAEAFYPIQVCIHTCRD